MKEGKKVIVIDEFNPASSSMVASGLINPVTGMRVAKSWMIDELLPAADGMYKAIEQDLGISICTPYDTLDFHATIQVRDIYKGKIEQHAGYLHSYTNDAHWEPFCNFHYGISAISGCRVVDMQLLCTTWRKRLLAEGCLLQEYFDMAECRVTADKVVYKDIEATRIIFCDGSAGLKNPYFSLLPFSLNKGEALIVRIPGMPQTHVLMLGAKLVPWSGDTFWVGSSFEWTYDNLDTTTAFRTKMEAQLRQWVRLPYTIERHWASERPATVDHKPFVGFHPLHPAIGIFNGMGAKGCSQAPYFAGVLAQHITNGLPLHPEADIKRYARILSKGM